MITPLPRHANPAVAVLFGSDDSTEFAGSAVADLVTPASQETLLARLVAEPNEVDILEDYGIVNQSGGTVQVYSELGQARPAGARRRYPSRRAGTTPRPT